MRKLLTVLSFASVGIGFSQNSISLDSCISWSKKNYPLIKQNEVTLQQTEQKYLLIYQKDIIMHNIIFKIVIILLVKMYSLKLEIL